MIKKVRIKNFKCYGQQGTDFNLAKINFIFGDNSSGKSTFLQFLEILASTCDHVGKYSRRDIDSHSFKGEPGVITAKIRVARCTGDSLRDEVWSFRPIYGSEEGYEIVSVEDEHRISRKDLNEVLPVPEGEEHVVHKAANDNSGIGGASNEEEIKLSNIADSESDAVASEYLNDIFTRLGIAYRSVVADSGISITLIHDLDFGIDVPLHEVGTGIRGLVRLAFDLKDWQGGILALEEPETNVNEKQMAPLAKVLIDEALKRDEGQLIVECHSKLMALQLATLVREERLRCVGVSDDPNLSVIEVVKTPSGSQAEQIRIYKDGEVAWRTGFFPAEGILLRKTCGI